MYHVLQLHVHVMPNACIVHVRADMYNDCFISAFMSTASWCFACDNLYVKINASYGLSLQYYMYRPY